MNITCEHCAAIQSHDLCRILHDRSGAHVVCARCYADLRPGADHRHAVPGKLYTPPQRACAAAENQTTSATVTTAAQK